MKASATAPEQPYSVLLLRPYPRHDHGVETTHAHIDHDGPTHSAATRLIQPSLYFETSAHWMIDALLMHGP